MFLICFYMYSQHNLLICNQVCIGVNGTNIRMYNSTHSPLVLQECSGMGILCSAVDTGVDPPHLPQIVLHENTGL